jgi:hypothetical protein
MNKKIIFLLIIFVITSISCFSSEKIVNLKENLAAGKIKFTLVDENGQKTFGQYLARVFYFGLKADASDETIEDYNGKVDIEKIKLMARYFYGIGSDILSIIFSLSFAGALYGVGLPYLISCSSSMFLIGMLATLGGVVESILFFIALGCLIYNGYNYYKIKKEIIDILNGIPASKANDSIRIKFCLNVSY